MARVPAKVATILGMNRFALNKGANDGVEQGNLVSITRAVDIIDPDTDSKLGESLAVVAQLQVIAVDPAFSIMAPPRDDERVFATGQTSAQAAESLVRGDEVSITVK